MHTPLHGIARQGVPSTSYSISYDVMKITLDFPVIIHNTPPPPKPFLFREALSRLDFHRSGKKTQ